MIELKNITKVYRTGISSVKALDGVSLTLPEKGMVFILGKSGCGKSTMLNILGGLDRPTSGEIVIKGRSAKNFKNADFDSYRNTFVGFIFQEYNVLPEFSVKQNVLLASELQNNRKGVSSLGEIMETVELKGLEARKPNTLSGGQKQRVAIARALIKNPEIILADEPTGALDSLTGRAVLDTLRKLSANKLVVVVSHDREFAENYADRIIELHDGKIVADRTRYESSEKLTEKVTLDDDGIHLTKEADEDLLATLNELLKNKKTVTVTLEEDGYIHRGGYIETDTEAIEKKTYTPEESAFIRSKFPLKYAIRMGASSMKCKPFWLIMTIILTTFALTAFGFFLSLMTYNSTKVLSTTLKSSELTALAFAKYDFEKVDDGIFSYVLQNQKAGTADEAKEFFGGGAEAILPVYTYSSSTVYGGNNFLISYYGGGFSYTIDNLRLTNDRLYYPGSYGSDYCGCIYGFTPATEKDLAPFGCKLLTGKMPEKENEVLISRLIAEAFVANGYFSFDSYETTSLRSVEELLGKTLTVANIELTVCGIFDCPMPEKKYDRLLEVKNIEELPYNEQEELNDLSSYLQNTLYPASPSTLLVVSDKFADAYGTSIILNKGIGQNFEMRFGGDETNAFYPYAAYQPFETVDKESVLFADKNKTSLAKGEMLIPVNDLTSLCWETARSNHENDYKDYTPEEGKAIENAINEEFADIGIDETLLYYGTREEMLDEIGKMLTYLKNNGRDLSRITLAGNYYDPEQSTVVENLAVVGYYTDPSTSELFVFEKSDFEIFYGGSIERASDLFDCFYVPKTADTCQRLSAENERKKDTPSSAFMLYQNRIAQDVAEYTSIIDICSTVFFWIGVVLAIFASLLLFSFIIMSINNKKKDIGILRALGARTVDVFKVFCSESILIVLICFVLSATFSALLVNLLDLFLISRFNLASVLFYYGPLQALAILALGIVVAVVSTILPVVHNSKKPPVDAIRAL